MLNNTVPQVSSDRQKRNTSAASIGGLPSLIEVGVVL
jgi:hypothetical protein